MSEQKREKPNLKRIGVWFSGVVILVIGGYWVKTAADTPASDPQFMWVYYGGAAILVGLGIMLYSRFALK
jgi:hypothetical protein